MRLKGFEYKLPKSDVIDIAKKLCSHIKIDHVGKEIHSSAIVGPCVVDFVSELDARYSLKSSKKADTTWLDPETASPVKLYFRMMKVPRLVPSALPSITFTNLRANM